MDNSRLSIRLKELRKLNNLNQEYVASQLDISRQAYSHYETGRNTPPTEALIKLAQLYHVPAAEFFALSASAPSNESHFPDNDSLDEFFHFFHDAPNYKYQALDRNEKLLIYFFNHLTKEDQEDLLEFLRIRTHRSKAD